MSSSPENWARHTYRRRLWPNGRSVREGQASLKHSEDEAEPVNPGPIAGFARPLSPLDVTISSPDQEVEDDRA